MYVRSKKIERNREMQRKSDYRKAVRAWLRYVKKHPEEAKKIMYAEPIAEVKESDLDGEI